jgi:hypothetical protein
MSAQAQFTAEEARTAGARIGIDRDSSRFDVETILESHRL